MIIEVDKELREKWKKVDRAIEFAVKCHAGQNRKGANQPYIFHPLEVMGIVATMTDNEDVLCGAVLHDTVEDTPATVLDIRKEFGDYVARLVFYESEDKHTDMPPEESWTLRKQEAINTLREEADIGAKMICLGDKVSNLRSFNSILLTEGEKGWEHFHQRDPLKHYWYYSSLLDALSGLEDYPAYKEYSFLMDSIFRKYLIAGED
ncbi:MAG: bifunctional (p)ppGpp synthetase/guanosine-3',5'-bis(diphosphate) 3'-pyrophosphohydrolase [Lachnospiraceae bacterium]|nr:bifunctional (p)ppGpp synthetase/guanosine-3',5'-bis(diphosphate) 3'-pyrophosphohydrolase [Candidatus Darwinimomas equi]